MGLLHWYQSLVAKYLKKIQTTELVRNLVFVEVIMVGVIKLVSYWFPTILWGRKILIIVIFVVAFGVTSILPFSNDEWA